MSGRHLVRVCPVCHDLLDEHVRWVNRQRTIIRWWQRVGDDRANRFCFEDVR